MEKNEFKDIIFADWYIIKEQIWLSWDKLRLIFSKLIGYKLKKIPPQQSRVYIVCCEALTNTYLMIGRPRYKKHLEQEQEQELTQIYKNSLKGIIPSFKEISRFIELTEEWFDKSGMSKIEREQHDPGDAVLEDR